MNEDFQNQKESGEYWYFRIILGAICILAAIATFINYSFIVELLVSYAYSTLEAFLRRYY